MDPAAIDPAAAAAAAVASAFAAQERSSQSDQSSGVPYSHLKGIFKRHDLNGDGALSRPEVAQLIQEFCELLHLEIPQRA